MFMLIMRPASSEKLLNDYFSKCKPYYSPVHTLRSADSEVNQEAAELFRIGFADYLTGEYQKALNQFSNAESVLTGKNPSLSRSVHFYSALSNLALYRRHKSKEYIDNAIHSIIQAEQAARTSKDELYFFKGLIYTIADQKEKAAQAFQLISEQSRFYKDGARMLKTLN
ncbi:MAG: hypothetical protein U5R06_04385 [candidate division KSB1 bacterium]|nr:hypothetical protein [candidate division KSB1 bacterium]